MNHIRQPRRKPPSSDSTPSENALADLRDWMPSWDVLRMWQTALSAIVGFVSIIITLFVNGSLARSANRRTESTKLKLEIYRDIIEACGRVSDTATGLNNYIRLAILQFGQSRHLKDRGVAVSLPDCRYLELSSLQASLQTAAIAIVEAVERWQVIDPRMQIFRTALAVALYDLRNAYSRDFVPIAQIAMPLPAHVASAEKPPSLRWEPPAGLTIADFTRVGGEVIEASLTLGAYVHDFQREMQGLLVGDLFHGRVPPRRPLDAQMQVVTLKRHKKLQRHFETETEWGRAQQQTANDVRAGLAARNSGGD